MSTKDKILDVLNTDLSPWTFDGSEPMCSRLFAVYEEIRDADDYCTCGHRREAHHAWGKCHGVRCKCSGFILSDSNADGRVTLTLSGREVAIIGATLRRCIGWDDPKELERFVNVAADHVRYGFTEAEMDAVLEKLAGAWRP